METTLGAKQDEVRALIDKSATKLVEQANDGLRNLSDKLRNKNLDEILRDAESFARRNPAAFIGVAAVAGFLAVRFLKSSSGQQSIGSQRSSTSQLDYRS